MKKILSIMMMLAAMTQFCACSDDNPEYTAPQQLQLASSDAFFEATGGTATVVVKSSEAITATVAESVDWLTASVSGNTVTLTATLNNSLMGRNGKVVLRSASGQTTAVIATQKGSVYGVEGSLNHVLDNTAGTISVPLKHSQPVKVTSLVDWMSGSFNDATSSVEVKVAANQSGWKRTGQVAFECGLFSDTITVTQFDFDDNVLGSYQLVYYNKNWLATPVVLEKTEDGKGYQMRFTGEDFGPYNIIIPITVDKQNLQFTISNIVDLTATVTVEGVEYKLLTMVMGLSEDNKIYRYNNAKLAIVATLVEDEDGIFFDMDANDQLDSSKYSFYCLRLGYGEGGYAGYKGAFFSFPYCYLQKD